MPDIPFAEVVVVATGQVTSVPADWLDSPALGHLYEKTVAQKTRDGEIKPIDPADVPTADGNTKDEIAVFAEKAGVDISEAKNKTEAVELINASLGSELTADPEPPPSSTVAANPDVQLVAGTQSSDPVFPVLINNEEN